MTRTDELAAFAVAAVPVFAGRLAGGPAGVLGRLGVPDETRPHGAAQAREPVSGLRSLGPLLPERLLGALELTIAAYDWAAAPVVLDDLPPAPPEFRYATVTLSGSRDSEVVPAVSLLDSYRRGISDRTLALVRELAAHPATAPVLTVPAEVEDEDAVAAAHGAAYLGLALAVAGAVVRQAGAGAMLDETAAIVGLAAGSAALLLREVPMPAQYDRALLAKRRAEYRPGHSSAHVAVSGHRFGLLEDDFPEWADFGGTGLAAVTAGGVVVRTGIADGHVPVQVAVLTEAPPELEDGDWEEIVEVSWSAAEGAASLIGPGPRNGRGLSRLTPPWPGDYRIRVHARGRDEADAHFESYKLIVWSAPAGPDVVHKRTDRLGHRLRGEPEPVREPRPEHAYRWVERGPLSQAATVTVVTGSTVPEVLRAFGADPGRPQDFEEIERELQALYPYGAGPWVTVLESGDAVLAVEYNGFAGSDAAVLEAASTGGRAASMFWNVNGVTRLSFAEGGRLLSSFEYLDEDDDLPPEVQAVLAGLDFDGPGERTGKGLVAVERFTGQGITEDNLTRIQAARIGYRIAD
ncbi:DUF6461 domain-containing protein [Symbioplanes lichenis]|uniref:DUF6461 domain-containing protein n=1 Tax=Symbioplanes lichenis TaxID=1629072 RepID=UPI002739B1CE|nr:DUF6461 domain-containing protein [Actinoplanes lichenis]